MKKNPLTKADHIELGPEMKKMRDKLSFLAIDIAQRYGKSSDIAKAAMNTHKHFEILRSKLDDYYFIEVPDAPENDSLYYGTEEIDNKKGEEEP